MIAAIDIPLDSVILETQMVELTEKAESDRDRFFQRQRPDRRRDLPDRPIHPARDSERHLWQRAVSGRLYAQIVKGNGRIISKPRIAAQSGSTAKIITGDALPILTAITLSGVNGVSQQVQYVNVGVTLQIAPRVTSDGFVSSHVYCVVSSVTGFQQGYPTISQRQAETSATVRDGELFVIGGLSQDSSINTRNKIPLLGDIPILGQVFRTDKSSRSKTELYIVVTPHIVHRVGSPTMTMTTTTVQPLVPPAAAASVPAGNPLDQQPPR